MFEVEREIGEWRGRLAVSGNLPEDRLEELESHLRDAMDDLQERGLDSEEAFLIALRRIGNLDELSRECAREITEETWRGIVLEPKGEGQRERRRDILSTLLLALAAGLLAKLPALFGVEARSEEWFFVYARNAALFCLPSVAWVLALVRRRGRALALALSLITLALALYLNFLPWSQGSDTGILTAIHLPFFLWIALLPLYAGLRWRETLRGMDFVRFTGEAFIYGLLLFCGVLALDLFVLLLFETASIKAGAFTMDWLLPICAFALPVGAARLAMAKRNVMETIAPVLARIFAPLFLAAMIVFIVATAVSGADPFADRDALIVFDLVLALVLALVLWSAAMRDPRASAGLNDWIDFGLALAALALDAFLLAAISGRIDAFGASPNRVAALGENLVLMVDLVGMAFLLGRHLFLRGAYEAVLRWQTAFLAVLFGWLGVVALAFPLIFGGR